MSITVTPISVDEIKDTPSILYKYRSWTDKYHKTIITSRSVYHARPSRFEDQKDCKSLRRDDLLTPLDIYNKYYNYAKLNSQLDELDCRKYATEWFWKSRLNDKNYIKEHQVKYFKDFDKRFGVLSLTANPCNIKMWKKYADQNKGFCVGLDSKKLFHPDHVGGGGVVTYCDELPDIMPLDSMEEEHIKQVLFKEREWDFEEEYRTYKFWQNPASEKDRTRILPKECFKEIIFGEQMNENHRNEIIQLCTKQNLVVDFYSVKSDLQGNITKSPYSI
jgi:hypothetical protein